MGKPLARDCTSGRRLITGRGAGPGEEQPDEILNVPRKGGRVELRSPGSVSCLDSAKAGRELMIGRGVDPGVGKPPAFDCTPGRRLIIGRGVLFEGSGAPEPRVGGREVVSRELVL